MWGGGGGMIQGLCNLRLKISRVTIYKTGLRHVRGRRSPSYIPTPNFLFDIDLIFTLLDFEWGGGGG